MELVFYRYKGCFLSIDSNNKLDAKFVIVDLFPNISKIYSYFWAWDANLVLCKFWYKEFYTKHLISYVGFFLPIWSFVYIFVII